MSTQFQIQFNSETGMRRVQIRPEEINIGRRSMGYYQVYLDNTYLFSICPVVASDGKNWELIEKERGPYLPVGFVNFLGNRIDEFYVN